MESERRANERIGGQALVFGAIFSLFVACMIEYGWPGAYAGKESAPAYMFNFFLFLTSALIFYAIRITTWLEKH